MVCTARLPEIRFEGLVGLTPPLSYSLPQRTGRVFSCDGNYSTERLKATGTGFGYWVTDDGVARTFRPQHLSPNTHHLTPARPPECPRTRRTATGCQP